MSFILYICLASFQPLLQLQPIVPVVGIVVRYQYVAVHHLLEYWLGQLWEWRVMA